MSAKPSHLYHFTCHDHGEPGIDAAGLIIPSRHPLLPAHVAPVVWLTDLFTPAPALGLTSVSLDCDRSEVRYTVTGDSAEPWLDFAERVGVPKRVRDALARSGDPRHWWVATRPLIPAAKKVRP